MNTHCRRATFGNTCSTRFAGTGYGSHDSALERVHAPGSAFRTLLHDLAFGMRGFVKYNLDQGQFEAAGNAITPAKIWGAANHAMVEGGANWCERCRVFVLHEPPPAGFDPNTATLNARFSFCASNPNISLALGEPPPDPNLRLNGFSCTPCPSGSTSDDGGVCRPCVGEIVGNTCQKCISDAVLDGATAASGGLPFNTGFDVNVPTPGDNCPNTFWLEVRTPGGFFAAGAENLTVGTSPSPLTAANCTRNFTLISALPDPATGYFSETSTSSTGVYPQTCPPPPQLCLSLCSSLPTHEVTPAEASGSLIRFGTPVIPNASLDVSAYKTVVVK